MNCEHIMEMILDALVMQGVSENYVSITCRDSVIIVYLGDRYIKINEQENSISCLECTGDTACERIHGPKAPMQELRLSSPEDRDVAITFLAEPYLRTIDGK